MKKSEVSRVKLGLRMVEKKASEKFNEISFEGRDSLSRENLLKYIISNSETLSLRNIESLQKIISQIQEVILDIQYNTI